MEALASVLPDSVRCELASVAALPERYELMKLIGQGRFSRVLSGTKKGTDRVFALKEVDVDALTQDEDALEALTQEVIALRRVFMSGNPLLRRHVPRLHEVICTSRPAGLYLVLDLIKGRELFALLVDEGALVEAVARALIKQLLAALHALHTLGIVHRDIKPENLMVTNLQDPTECTLVVIDFGYAGCTDSPAEGLRGLAGSPEYCAPEVLLWLDADIAPTPPPPYDSACDLWSAGVTAFVLLSGDLPFALSEDDDPVAMHNVVQEPLAFAQPLWRQMAGAVAFVRACVCVDPKQRPTAQKALKLDWFTQPLTMDAASPVVAASRAKGGSSKQSVTVGGGAAVPRGGGNKGGQAVAAAASSEAPKASSFRQHDRTSSAPMMRRLSTAPALHEEHHRTLSIRRVLRPFSAKATVCPSQPVPSPAAAPAARHSRPRVRPWRFWTKPRQPAARSILPLPTAGAPGRPMLPEPQRASRLPHSERSFTDSSLAVPLDNHFKPIAKSSRDVSTPTGDDEIRQFDFPSELCEDPTSLRRSDIAQGAMRANVAQMGCSAPESSGVEASSNSVNDATSQMAMVNDKKKFLNLNANLREEQKLKKRSSMEV